MPESLQPLTDRTLERLRKLGDGNGLAPESIELIETQESTYTVEALLRLAPSFDMQSASYVGAIKGKKIKALPNFAALTEEVNRRKQSFEKAGDWLPDALTELRESPGHGWGLDGGKIPLPKHDVTLAANEKCPGCRGSGLSACQRCQGQGIVVCEYCHGRKEENCYHCFSKGEDPVRAGQPCPICLGKLFAPCRYCRATGFLPCPACQGKGGAPCPHCQGAGSATQQVTIKAGVEIHFHIPTGSLLPSGLLRSLDRLGMKNLANGHADIEMIEPERDDPDAEQSLIFLRAKIPFADIKARLMGRAIMIASFGKKGLLSGVPAFLDEALRPWRECLVRAAMGVESLDKALEARAIREALALTLSGKTQTNDLRRLYPLGLSPDTAKEIMTNMDQALRKATLRARAFVSATSLAASATLFAGLFLSPPGRRLAQTLAPKTLLLFEVFLPLGVMGLSAYAFAHVVKWTLQSRFPNLSIPLGHGLGKLGHGTLGGILAIYGMIYALTKGAF